MPQHASKFLSQVAYILGTCTYVFEHARLLSVMNAKLIEDLIVPDNNFWTCMLIHVFSLVLLSSCWTSTEFFLIFLARVSSRHFLHPLLAGRCTSRSMRIQKSALHAISKSWGHLWNLLLIYPSLGFIDCTVIFRYHLWLRVSLFTMSTAASSSLCKWWAWTQRVFLHSVQKILISSRSD